MKRQLVEVIVPVYLSQPSLYPIVERCLQSLRDTHPDFKILLVNDASPLPVPDNWQELCDTYLSFDENKGYVGTVNQALSAATGDIIVVANSDLFFKAGDLERFTALPDHTIASPADTASYPDDRFGAIFGLTRATYEFLGPLDSRYKHFYADNEYYERAKTKGVSIIKWYDIVIEHAEGATYKTIDKEALLEADWITKELINRGTM